MAKDKEFKYEIEEIIGTLKESDKHDWCKALTRISWNDAPSTLDLRNINFAQNRIGKGISLSDEEADRLTNLLLELDYGDMVALQKALNKKKERFTVSSKDVERMFDEDSDDGKLRIDINIGA